MKLVYCSVKSSYYIRIASGLSNCSNIFSQVMEDNQLRKKITCRLFNSENNHDLQPRGWDAPADTQTYRNVLRFNYHRRCVHVLICALLLVPSSSMQAHRLLYWKGLSLCLSFSLVSLSWSAKRAALQRSGDEECDNKEVEDKEVLVHTHAHMHTHTHTHTHTQQCAVVMVSTALAPPYCKQGGGDRLPVLVNIISVIQQTRHCQHLAVPRHNQH